MGYLTHMLSLQGSKLKKIAPLFRKGIGNKIAIRTELCMTKYIIYIYTYKTGLEQLVK